MGGYPARRCRPLPQSVRDAMLPVQARVVPSDVERSGSHVEVGNNPVFESTVPPISTPLPQFELIPRHHVDR